MTYSTKPLPELAARRAVRELAERFPCWIEADAPGLARIRVDGADEMASAANVEFAAAVAESFARGTFERERAAFEL